MPATALARQLLGRPLPNAALLCGFAALTGQVGLDSVLVAIRDRFAAKVGESNAARPRRRSRTVRDALSEVSRA